MRIDNELHRESQERERNDQGFRAYQARLAAWRAENPDAAVALDSERRSRLRQSYLKYQQVKTQLDFHMKAVFLAEAANQERT